MKIEYTKNKGIYSYETKTGRPVKGTAVKGTIIDVDEKIANHYISGGLWKACEKAQKVKKQISEEE